MIWRGISVRTTSFLPPGRQPEFSKRRSLTGRLRAQATRPLPDFFPLPAFTASSRIRVIRAVSCTRSVVNFAPSPDITEPAARANRSASAWSSKYKTTCPAIFTSPWAGSPRLTCASAYGIGRERSISDKTIALCRREQSKLCRDFPRVLP